MALVTFEDFQKVEMRVGRIVAADDFPEARSPSYKLRIDFGPHGLRKSSAAVQPCYRASELVGRAAVAVTKFPPLHTGPLVAADLSLRAVHPAHQDILLRTHTQAAVCARIPRDAP